MNEPTKQKSEGWAADGNRYRDCPRTPWLAFAQFFATSISFGVGVGVGMDEFYGNFARIYTHSLFTARYQSHR